MKKISFVLIICIIMNLLISCSSGNTDDNTVDEDHKVYTTRRSLNGKEYTLEEREEMWEYLDVWRTEHDLSYFFIEFDEAKFCEFFKNTDYTIPKLDGAYTYSSGTHVDLSKLRVEVDSDKEWYYVTIEIDSFTLLTEEIDFENITIDDFERKSLGYDVDYTEDFEPEKFREYVTYEYGKISVSVLYVCYYLEGSYIDPGDEIRCDEIFSWFLGSLNCH